MLESDTSITGSPSAANEVFVPAGQTTPGGEDPKAQVTYTHGPGKTPQQISQDWKNSRLDRAKSVMEKIEGQTTEEAAEAAREFRPPSLEELMAKGRERSPVAAEHDAQVEGTDDGTVADTEAVPAGKAATGSPTSELERIEKAARAARLGASRDRARRAEIARVNGELAGMKQRAAQLEAQARSGAEFRQKVLSNPLNALKEHNLSPEQLVAAAIREGTPEAKFEAMAEMVKRAEERAQKLEESIRAEKDTAARSAVESDFVNAAKAASKSGDPRYPNLKGMPKSAILSWGKEVAKESRDWYLKNKGVIPEIPDHKILEYMDWQLERAKPKTAAPNPKAPAAKTPQKTAPAGTSKSRPEAPRTTTNSMSSGAPARPDNFANLSRAQRIAKLTEMYRRQG
jgi:hypothetical protein